MVCSEDGRTRSLKLIGGIPVVCASGDLPGAYHYAYVHNMGGTNDTPIVISIDAEPPDLFIDGRDFLYNIMQFGATRASKEGAMDCFGEAIDKYVEKAWKSSDSHYRIAMCDLAVQDPDVVAAHYQNRHVIQGRYGTLFSSAFFVRLPITPDRVAMASTEGEPETAPVTYRLDQLRGR